MLGMKVKSNGARERVEGLGSLSLSKQPYLKETQLTSSSFKPLRNLNIRGLKV